MDEEISWPTGSRAHEHPISKVLCSDVDVEIPRYQRPYSWETTQAAELLDDLATAAHGTPDQPYFLGSIVLTTPRDGTTSEVIDGQQRLTTLTILLAVLRSSVRTTG